VTVKVNPAGAVYSRFPANARVPLPRIAGHRDGDATDCPGNVLYGELPAIRTGVRGLAPNPTRATLTLSLPVTPPSTQSTSEAVGAGPSGSPSSAATGQTLTLAGVLELLDGTPVAAAPVLIQMRTVSRKGEVVSERTLAETTTDAAGRWTLAATPVAPAAGEVSRTKAKLWLRVLCPGRPGLGACVSDPRHVPASFSLSAPAANPPAG
jgi:hypothetical protein